MAVCTVSTHLSIRPSTEAQDPPPDLLGHGLEGKGDAQAEAEGEPDDEGVELALGLARHDMLAGVVPEDEVDGHDEDGRDEPSCQVCDEGLSQLLLVTEPLVCVLGRRLLTFLGWLWLGRP